MADSAPLLLPSYTSASEETHPPLPLPLPLPQHCGVDGDKHAVRSIDDAIEACVGRTGSAQLLRAIFVALAWVFDAQQTFISVFADAHPSWHCTDTDARACSAAAASTPCGLPPGAWAWDLPASASVVSDWALECAGPSLVSLPASSFFLGCVLGGLVLATLADSALGRKGMLFASCFIMSLTGILTAFSPNVWAYSALRFVCGFGRAMVGSSALVLCNEMVGRKWRDRISICGFFCFTLGFLSLPALAYANRRSSWRQLYLWTSVSSLCYTILLHFLIHESPRWLFVRGRRDEAVAALKHIAVSAGSNSVNSSFSSLYNVGGEETWNADVFSAVKMLYEKKWAFRRLAAVMIVGFGVGIVYYGMPLNVGNLGSNLYLSVTFNALAELPSSLVTFLLIGKLNRRGSVILFAAVSGACSVACVYIASPAWARMAVEVVSFFSACTAFNITLIFAIELFPTCVRNSAISMAREAIVLGGALAPLLVAEGRKRGLFVSFGVFGLAIGCCGLFAACLPETRGRSICDTLEEEEHKQTIDSSATV
ncbi:organic cation/carnitine transporter 2-like [Ananas comosus]|uniref:H(+)/Pi cotransporter n=1 Tax=Ananas comosus TaxID=4615 RepID=A0A6P5FA43_ANACO|nr:organic cation/carnitine transporter 2-like [Ananas comosus]